MNEQNFTHLQSCRASTAAAPSWSIHAIVQVTLKNINYSQHIRHEWLPSFGPILSSQYLLTCVEGVLGSGVMSPLCGHSGAKFSRLFKLVSSFLCTLFYMSKDHYVRFLKIIIIRTFKFFHFMIMEGKIEKRRQTGREVKQTIVSNVCCSIYLIMDALVFLSFLIFLQV